MVSCITFGLLSNQDGDELYILVQKRRNKKADIPTLFGVLTLSNEGKRGRSQIPF
jgi:hypothetical protein